MYSKCAYLLNVKDSCQIQNHTCSFSYFQLVLQLLIIIPADS